MQLEELSELSTLNIKVLKKLDNIIKYIISDELVQAIQDNKENIAIKLGNLGTLIISLTNNELKYHFKPSKSLDNIVCKSLINETNSLTKSVECAIPKQFKDIYRDFF